MVSSVGNHACLDLPFSCGMQVKMELQNMDLEKESNRGFGYQVDFVGGNKSECVSFDLRPSDAINIAVRCKVPIQVNKYVAYSDGMRVIDSGKLSKQTHASDGLLFTELDRPNGQPCFDTKEFDLLRNMMQAVDEERYDEAE
ncbi:PREDICTED: bifunctional nuclease 2-like [Camelina sativa]|uniref:Bifunctional nuclease 2-like n=1 Tax=Camelina sativa TaxID=90675 RepID=A0ABM0Y805_CAMSA|nr:PREDICTED: bifunctional nuclease 2-like [Camelina sativa]